MERPAEGRAYLKKALSLAAISFEKKGVYGYLALVKMVQINTWWFCWVFSSFFFFFFI